MKTTGKKAITPAKPKTPLKVCYHARFQLPGEKAPQENTDFLLNQCEALAAYLQDDAKIKDADMAKRRAELEKDKASFAETPKGKYCAMIDKLVQESKGRLTPEMVKKKSRALRKIGVHPGHLIQTIEFAQKQDALDRLGKVNEASGATWQALFALDREARTGPDEVAERAIADLYQVAVMAARFLETLYPERAEIFKKIAPKHKVFPVVATRNPRWATKVKKMLADIELGTKTDEASFTDAAYDDIETYPARAYARAIVDCLRDNQERMCKLKFHQALFTHYRPEHDVQPVEIPGWAQECLTLKDFNRDSALAWFAIGKKMMRAECPDFHTRPEWGRYAKRFEGLTKGEIQNRIFDLIESAIKTIAKPPVKIPG